MVQEWTGGPKQRKDYWNYGQDTNSIQEAPFTSGASDDAAHSRPAINLLGNGGTNGLREGKRYRVISDNDFYFVQGNEDALGALDLATVGIWVPARTPITLEASRWSHIRVLGTGIVQAVELG